ncbi:MAG: hypothetical protein A2486_07125 [Burkholderiales bacterium RIFOXYC12_FULL_65_23]|uniref:hypothetical protein n=1 Tax=Malikia spinosa TaxID=86180 RepID=UPI0008ABA80A|nr:MAG: hypothetical protein A2486_07125 [Burkholderiales bacterium RIFOXYC12_FULL_65_23]
MNITIDLDIQGAIAAALQPEKLQPILDQHITKAITQAIDDATGFRSEFRKALTVQLTEAMPHGLGIDDVAKFQHILSQAATRLVQECNANTVQVALERAIKNVMPDVPPVIKLSDLLKEARDGFHKEQNEAFYAYLEMSEYGDGHLYLDENENPGDRGYRSREDRKYRAEHQLAFTKEGEVYALRLDGKQITPASRPDIVGSFYSILMAMYVGRTKIEVDMDDDDVEYAAQSNEDY